MGGADDHYGSQVGAGGVLGFYGETPISKQTLTQQTTLTTTQLRAELTALQGALKNLGLFNLS